MIKWETYLNKQDVNNIKYRVVSYGGGTQSTAMILLGLEGKLHARPDLAIYIDNKSDNSYTYDYIKIVSEYVKDKYGFEIVIVPGDNIIEDIINGKLFGNNGKKYIQYTPPFHSNNKDGTKGILPRHCTSHYKIEPYWRYVRKRFDIKRSGVTKNAVVESWIGLSLDEIYRMSKSRLQWIINRYPLIENGYRRQDSIDYVKSVGLPEPPRTSCIFCPYQNVEYFKMLKNYYPNEFKKVIEIEQSIQDRMGELYIFYDLVRIKDLDFKQATLFDPMVEDCGGLCGT